MLRPLCVSIFSAAKSVGGRNITFWVFHEDLRTAELEQVQQLIEQFPEVSLIHQQIDVNDFAGLSGLHGEVIPLAKPLIPHLVNGLTHRIIYLDADTVVISGLNDLYRHSLDGNILGAVSYEALGEAYTSDFFQSHGLDLNERAFNSGVLVVDVEAWNKEKMTRKVLDFLKVNSSKYDGADQASLNVIFHKRFYPLRIRYNKRASPGSRLEQKYTKDGIVHFVGIPKPWDVGGRWLNQNYSLYEQYRQEAGVRPRTTREVVRDTGWRRTGKGLLAGLRAAIP